MIGNGSSLPSSHLSLCGCMNCSKKGHFWVGYRGEILELGKDGFEAGVLEGILMDIADYRAIERH